MQVFPPFRLIPRKVTLIIGAMMQVGAKGLVLAHCPHPMPAPFPGGHQRAKMESSGGVDALASEG